jgi:dephospho-CoA kinase
MTYSIGLIGGIACGKSTVLKIFRDLSIECFSADEVAKEIMQPKQIAYQKILEHLGYEYLLPNHELDRAKIRKKMLADSDFKHWLEQLTHPLIRKRLQELQNNAHSPYCVLEIPLLKNKKDYHLDRILLIQSNPSRQKEFLKQRGLTEAEIQPLLRAQIPENTRLALADDIIDNTHSFETLLHNVQALHQKYRLKP